jgi:PAS domain-containing protein
MQLEGSVPVSTPPHPTTDYHRIFNSAPAHYIVVDRDLRIVGATDAFLAAMRRNRDDIVGRIITEEFADNPDDPDANGTEVLRTALERVMVERAGHKLPVQRYDIELDGVFQERYFQPLNEPVFAEDGEVEFIIHGVEDVTDAMVSGNSD